MEGGSYCTPGVYVYERELGGQFLVLYVISVPNKIISCRVYVVGCYKYPAIATCTSTKFESSR